MAGPPTASGGVVGSPNTTLMKVDVLEIQRGRLVPHEKFGKFLACEMEDRDRPRGNAQFGARGGLDLQIKDGHNLGFPYVCLITATCVRQAIFPVYKLCVTSRSDAITLYELCRKIRYCYSTVEKCLHGPRMIADRNFSKTIRFLIDSHRYCWHWSLDDGEAVAVAHNDRRAFNSEHS